MSRLVFFSLPAAVVVAATAALAPARTSFAPPGSAPRANGRIQGTVEISTSLSTRRPQFRIYSEPGAGSTPAPSPRNPVAAELRNVVIYLDSLQGAPGQQISHNQMAQRGERFVPHVLPVYQGATVEFPNEDNVYHNVFSLSGAAGKNGFDLGRYPKGASKSWTFAKPGTVQVFCHIHSDMSAVVLVLPNPYFTIPDDTHRFVLEDVPEGDYTIVGWHQLITPVTHRVHVTAGQTTTVDFNIPLPQGRSR